MAELDDRTRYQYQKRIRELEEENQRLLHYRTVAKRIFNATVGIVKDGKQWIGCGWIIEQFEELLK